MVFKILVSYLENNKITPNFKDKTEAEQFRLELEYWKMQPAYTAEQLCIQKLQVILDKEPKDLPGKCI